LNFEASKTGFEASETDFDASNLNFGASETDFDASNPDFGASETDFDASNPDFGASETDFDASNPDFGASETDFGASNPDFGASESDVDASEATSDASDPPAGSVPGAGTRAAGGAPPARSTAAARSADGRSLHRMPGRSSPLPDCWSPMHLIAISTGNTRTHLGLLRDEAVEDPRTISNDDLPAIIDVVTGWWRSLHGSTDAEPSARRAAIVLASVNESVSGSIASAIRDQLGTEVYVIGEDLPVQSLGGLAQLEHASQDRHLAGGDSLGLENVQ